MYKNEFGRSMVEILGIIAIIAVLSVAGVYGYTVAMQKHKANEIIQLASILYTMAHSANGGTGDCLELSKTSLDKNPGGVGVNIVADPSVEGHKAIVNIQINSSNYEKICDLIRTMIPSNTEYELNDCGNISVSCNNNSGGN